MDDNFEITETQPNGQFLFRLKIKNVSKKIAGNYSVKIEANDGKKPITSVLVDSNLTVTDDVDICRKSPCSRHGVCKPEIEKGIYKCDCQKGFLGEKCQHFDSSMGLQGNTFFVGEKGFLNLSCIFGKNTSTDITICTPKCARLNLSYNEVESEDCKREKKKRDDEKMSCHAIEHLTVRVFHFPFPNFRKLFIIIKDDKKTK